MSKFVLLVACVQKCASQQPVQPTYTGKCAHDASAKALTHELLAQGYKAYKDIECVPAYLFCQADFNSNCDVGRYAGKDVKVEGKLDSLLYIERNVFTSSKGKITWTADSPNLKGVGVGAFYQVQNRASAVTIGGQLDSLQSIGDYAFDDFRGKITWTADSPNLREVGTGAFTFTPNPASTVTIGGELKSLQSIGRRAFDGFKGKVTFTAECPNLKVLGGQAFSFTSNPDSRVVLSNAPLLETIGYGAFQAFKGIIKVVGEYPQLKFIGNVAFNALDSRSWIEIKCRSDEGWEVDTNAFKDFGGTHIRAGEQVVCNTTTTTTTTMTSTSATSTTVTITTTTTRLQVNDDCDPYADVCDKAKNLVCSMDAYECRYGTTTISTAATEESGQEKTSNVGGIAGGAVGGAVLLAVLVFVAYRCGRMKELNEVRRRTKPRPAAQTSHSERPDVPQEAYGQTTTQNPAYNVAAQEATYAEIDDSTAYEIPGAVLRGGEPAQQSDDDDLDV